jgi:hypothetical protein
MKRISAVVLSLAIAATTLHAGPAAGQIGSLVRKAKSVGSGSSSGQNAAIVVPPEQQITGTKLDQLDRGLSAMQASMDAARKSMAQVRTPDDYHSCMMPYLLPNNPEALKIQNDYMAGMRALAQTNPTGPQMQAGGTKLQEDMMAARQALVTRHCGPDPDKNGSSQASRYATDAQAAGEKASGMSHDSWLMMMERVPPYCALPAAKRGSGDVRAEGQYVYLSSESQALAPRCATLMPKMHLTVN